MKTISDIVTYGLSNLWTVLLFLWFLNNLFRPISSSKVFKIIFTIGATLLTTLINILSPTIEINMIAYITVMSTLAFCYSPRFQAVFIGFYFFFTHLLVEDIVIISFSAMGYVTYNTAMDNSIVMRVSLMLIIELLFFICILLVKPKIKVIKEKKVYFTYWSISFILATVALMILHFTTINAMSDEQASPIQLVNSIVLFCFMHFLLICLSGIIQFDITRAENRQLQTISQYYADKMQESIASQNHDRILRHDLKKVFYAIQLMAAKSDIDGIREMAISYSGKLTVPQINKANTGIPEIDDITNHLLAQLSKNVECNFAAIVNEPLKINSRDCIVLIGNLLENAIEAVQRASSEKILNIRVTLDRNIFHVEIVNSYNGILNYDADGYLLTSKNKKKDHGYGLRSIDSIVQKYDGTSDYLPLDSGMFSSSVILFQSRI